MTDPTKSAVNMKAPSPPKQQETKPSFNRFRDLPQETRTQIWEFILPKPRIVHMSSMKTRAETQRLLTRPESWGPQNKLEFCFYENGNDLYRGDKSEPEKSPLRLACQEARAIWQGRYGIPEIRLSHEWRVKLAVESKRTDICGKEGCVVLKASRPAPFHVTPHRHRFYKNAEGSGFLISVRGLIDMKRDTLIMDPVVFSLVNGDLGLELDISNLRTIAYTSSIEYRPVWKPPGHDGSYEVIEGIELFLLPEGDGYNLQDPDINENLIVEQHGDEKNDLMYLEEEGELPAERTKTIASKDIWKMIIQCCPQISSIQYIILGERNAAIYSKTNSANWEHTGNLPGPKASWEVHEHHLLPLCPSVREIIMNPENKDTHELKHTALEYYAIAMIGVYQHFNSRFEHGVQLEEEFQDYLKRKKLTGSRKFWRELKFQVCVLGDAIDLCSTQIAPDHQEASMDVRNGGFDMALEDEIPFEFTNGKASPFSSSSSSSSGKSPSKTIIPQNIGQEVEVLPNEDGRCSLHVEHGIYIYWDPSTKVPIQVSQNIYSGVTKTFRQALDGLCSNGNNHS